MNMRRTTITAPNDALATLEAEARRRDTSLTAIVTEAIVEKAEAIRGRRAPRVGLGRSTDGASARELAAEPVAESPQ